MAEDRSILSVDSGLFSLVSWSQIPDLGLYMDQVITFIGRMYRPVYGDDVKSYISAPMINNYVKGKLIPRPVGKKYCREQIALLVMIVALKQVCSMDEIRRMLTPLEGESIEALYTAFCARFTSVINGVLSAAYGGNAPMDCALEMAILSSGYHAGCVAALSADAAIQNAVP